MNENKTFTVDSRYAKMRLDKALAMLIPDKSRNDVLKAIKSDLVFVNGVKQKPAYCLNEDDIITISFLPVKLMSANPEKIDLNIVFEDDHIIIINKPVGLVTHPSFGHNTGTLVNGLLYHSNSLSSIGGSFRPGIVHRLDKDTSGLLVVAKTDYAHLHLSKQLLNKTMNRHYYALVSGIIPVDAGKIDAPIGRHSTNRQKQAVNVNKGKEAITHFKVVKRYSDMTLIDCQLETGRTHQIRVHLSYINHPIINDVIYGKKYRHKSLTGHLLHAYKLVLIHPFTKKKVTYQIPLPNHYQQFVDSLT